MSDELRASNQWAVRLLDNTGKIILDPDGWDRKNYEQSFNVELITFDEFMRRVERSTTITISA